MSSPRIALANFLGDTIVIMLDKSVEASLTLWSILLVIVLFFLIALILFLLPSD